MKSNHLNNSTRAQPTRAQPKRKKFNRKVWDKKKAAEAAFKY